MDGATANARRKYHHVHHGGKLTERDIAGMVRGMENKDAEIARLTAERDAALAQVAAVIERAADAVNHLAGDDHTIRWAMHEIRALTPADASAALSRMLDAAYAAGQERMREAAAIYVDAWFYDPATDEEDTTLSDAIRTLPITPQKRLQMTKKALKK